MASLDTVLLFGKYRGLTIESVAKFKPEYLIWAHKNLEWFSLDKKALNHITPLANAHSRQMAEQQNAWAHGFGLNAKRFREKYDMRRISIEVEERNKAGLKNEQIHD